MLIRESQTWKKNFAKISVKECVAKEFKFTFNSPY